VIHYAILEGLEAGVSTYVSVDPAAADKTQPAIIHIEAQFAKPNVWPSHIKWRGDGVFYSNGSGEGNVRRASAYEGKDFKKIKISKSRSKKLLSRMNRL